MTFYYDHAHALGHQRRPGPDHHRAGLASRASSAARATGARPACGRGCRTPTATAPTPGPPTRSPPAATSSRSPHGLSLGRELRRRRQQRRPVGALRRHRRHDLATSWPRTRSAVEDLAGRLRARPEQGQGALGRPATWWPGPPTSVPAAPTRHLRGGGCTGRRPAAWPSTPRPSPAARARRLRYDPAGLPAAVVAAHPELKGYLALRLSTQHRPAGRRRSCAARSPWAVRHAGPADSTPPACRSPACSTTSTPAAAPRHATASLARRPRRRSRLWAPTAQEVALLTLAARGQRRRAGRGGHAVAMRRGADGVWSVPGAPSWRDARYLYEVRSTRPTTGKVETNLVTDPYSVALTHELDPLGRRRPRPTRPCSRAAGGARRVAGAGAGRRLDDLRAARARLLDQRHDRAGGAPRHLPRVRRRTATARSTSRRSPRPG